MKKNNEGITLIEMIVVVAIMGIMLGIFGYSLSMISHRRVSNNALSIKQSIQVTQTFNKSQGNTNNVYEATTKEKEANGNAAKLKQASDYREKGLCKMKIVGPTDDNSYPYIYIYLSDSVSNLDDDNTCEIAGGSQGKVRLEKKTKIIVTYKSGTTETDVEIKKGTWADIRTSRITGGFIASKCSTSDNPGVPVKIEVSDGDRTITLTLSTFTGLVTKEEGKKDEKSEEN
ncbi:MAG: type II secretion system protein [Lachnospiraceae bacterium]|nr:type II secretion system protein [Lachnospiraceae bacterium]